MKTCDVRVLTWPRRRKVPIFYAESGGVGFMAYKRTGWSENTNAFAGIAGAPFRDNLGAPNFVSELQNPLFPSSLGAQCGAQWQTEPEEAT